MLYYINLDVGGQLVSLVVRLPEVSAVQVLDSYLNTIFPY